MEKDASAWWKYLRGVGGTITQRRHSRSQQSGRREHRVCEWEKKRARRTGGPVRSPEDEEATANGRSSAGWPAEAEPG